MERVSAQCMPFPTPLSKEEFAIFGNFYWPHRRICHHFWNIWRVIFMTLN